MAEAQALARPASPRPSLALAGRLVAESAGYLVVSALALAVDFGLLVLLTETARLNYLAAAAVAFTAGLVVNYLLSVAFVFKDRRLRSRRLQFALFVAIGLAGLALTEAVMALLVGRAGVHYALAKLLAAGASFSFNFVARRGLLFTGASRRP